MATTPQPLAITLGGPETALLGLLRELVSGVLQLATTHRQTMSQAMRDEHDLILVQIYWDIRTLEQKAGLLGPPLPRQIKPEVPK